jgi:hypothetical protein
MLFSSGLDKRGEMDQLMALFMIHEISQTLRPSILELHQNLNQLDIIFQLWINYFDILFILLKEVAEVLESFLYADSEGSNCFRLIGTDSSDDSFRS